MSYFNWDNDTDYDESYISRIKMCSSRSINATDGGSGANLLITTSLIEADLKSMCTDEMYDGSYNQQLGEVASYLDSECDEINLDEGECINDFTTFYDPYGFVTGFGYNTSLGNSGVITPL
jgi:hypothetical protein